MASGASVPLVAFVQFGPRHQPPARCWTISDATHVPKIAPQRGFAALPRAGERDDGEALRRLPDVRSQVALDDHVAEHGTRVRLIQNWILDLRLSVLLAQKPVQAQSVEVPAAEGRPRIRPHR